MAPCAYRDQSGCGAVLRLGAMWGRGDAAFGWWWSDAVAALAIAVVLLGESGRVLASSQRELGRVGADG